MKTALDFGAVGDGVADDTAALQSACDAGGIAHLPAGRYRITRTLDVPPLVSLQGEGAGVTVIEWAGAAGGTMLTHTGATGMGIGSLKLDGCGIAAKCAVITACVSCHYDNLTLQRATDAVLSVLPTAAANCMFNTFSNVYLSAGGEPCPGVTALRLGADADGFNACHNVFTGLKLEHGATGIHVGNADNNLFLMTYAFRRPEAVQPAYEVDFSAGGLSRSNYFYHFQGQAHSSAGSNNTILMYDLSNGESAPVIDDGAALEWSGWGHYPMFWAHTLGVEIGGADWDHAQTRWPAPHVVKVYRSDNGQEFAIALNNQTRECEFWVSPDGSPHRKTLTLGAAGVGFFGARAHGRQTITGNKQDGSALASLIQALAAFGLVEDATE